MREREFYSQNEEYENDNMNFEENDMFELFTVSNVTNEGENIKDDNENPQLSDEQKEEVSEKIDNIFNSIVKKSFDGLDLGGDPFTDPWGDNKVNQQDTIEKLINLVVENFNQVSEACGTWTNDEKNGNQSFIIDDKERIKLQSEEIMELEKAIANLDKKIKIKDINSSKKSVLESIKSEIQNSRGRHKVIQLINYYNMIVELTSNAKTVRNQKNEVRKEKRAEFREINEEYNRRLDPEQQTEFDEGTELEDCINELRNTVQEKRKELDSKRGKARNRLADYTRNVTIGTKDESTYKVQASDFVLKDGTRFCVNPITKDDVYLLLVPRAKDSPIDENEGGSYNDVLALDGFDFTQEFSELSDNEISLLKSVSGDILNYYKVDLNLADEGVDIEIVKWNKLNKGKNFDSAIKSLLLQEQLNSNGGVVQNTSENEWKERQLNESMQEMEEHYEKLLGDGSDALLPQDFYHWLVGIISIANENNVETISVFLKKAAEFRYGDYNDLDIKTIIEKIIDRKESELSAKEIAEAVSMVMVYVSHLLVEEQKSQVVDKDGKGELKSKTVNRHSQEPTTSTQQGTYQKYDSKRSPEYGRKVGYEKPPSNFEIESKIIWMLNYGITVLENKSEFNEK